YLLADGGTGSTYRWTPGLAAGTYDVEVWYVKHQTYSVAPYTIAHAGQTTNATLDQSVGGNAWYPIAAGITFDGSGAEYVEVSDASGKTAADAVRFVYTGGSGGGTVTEVYYRIKGSVPFNSEKTLIPGISDAFVKQVFSIKGY
ncbi:MAG TPA: hypothetical protein VET88_05265, partial [Gammaproteobacteria bacterium]|nr:hypothetical protein [Gammaproteobacteria bacterium]